MILSRVAARHAVSDGKIEAELLDDGVVYIFFS